MTINEYIQMALLAFLLFFSYQIYTLYEGGYLIFNVNILQHNLPINTVHHG
jgi:hypothetical protein